MIIGWFIDAITGILTPLVDLLPQTHLDLPSGSGIGSSLSDVDALVPILGVLRVAAVMLAALVVFLGLRIAILLWQQVKW
jgi:hypothetical protein